MMEKQLIKKYKSKLHEKCDEQCFYNCSEGGSIEPKCLIDKAESDELLQELWNIAQSCYTFRDFKDDTLKFKIGLIPQHKT